jgi:hypothetical protein
MLTTPGPAGTTAAQPVAGYLSYRIDDAVAQQQSEDVRVQQRPRDLQDPIPSKVRPGELVDEWERDADVGEQVHGVPLLMGETPARSAHRQHGDGSQQGVPTAVAASHGSASMPQCEKRNLVSGLRPGDDDSHGVHQDQRASMSLPTPPSSAGIAGHQGEQYQDAEPGQHPTDVGDERHELQRLQTPHCNDDRPQRHRGRAESDRKQRILGRDPKRATAPGTGHVGKGLITENFGASGCSSGPRGGHRPPSNSRD